MIVRSVLRNGVVHVSGPCSLPSPFLACWRSRHRFALDRRFASMGGLPEHMRPDDDITELLTALGAGDRSAMDRLLPLVYGELHQRAHRQLARRRPGETLSTTAL